MKKIVTLFLLVILIGLTACGSPRAPVGQTPQGEDKRVEQPEDGIKQITVASIGGKIERLIRDDFAPKFTKKTGIKVNYVSGISSEIYSKLQLQKNAPQIDIATLVPGDVIRAANAGLTEKIDPNKFPNMSKMDQKYVYGDSGIPIFGYTVGIAYNTKIFDENGWSEPTSWNDLYREEFKGKTAYPEITNEWGFAAYYNLGMANGGSLDNLDPAIEKAKEIAAISDTFYKNSTQMLPVMQQETAAVSILANYVVTDLVDSGLPIKMNIPNEGSPLQSLSALITKDTPRKAEAEQFINFIISETSQEKIAQSGFYSVLTDIELPEKYESVIGIKETDKVYTPDFIKIADVREMWTERFVKEVVPELGKK
jgi:putative spermidine/putrescine transport system substrate-binding protein